MANASREKHLHGRGEDGLRGGLRASSGETPPRTWRRPESAVVGTLHTGNTSTDVEKTAAFVPGNIADGKHLHGRGEDFCKVRILCCRERNTSTDVEKTYLLTYVSEFS